MTALPEPLSYCQFLQMQSDNIISRKQGDDLIDHAYAEAAPILFRKAEESVSPSMYSLNFLWIHKAKLSEGGHLMGADENAFMRRVLDPLVDWQTKQPEAVINFWYDSTMIGETTIEETLRALRERRPIDESRIRFRDIRSIPFVGENPGLFKEDVPVYFRVDLAKAITADYVLRQDGLAYVVNIDNDIVAVVREQLFDQQTFAALQGVGYTFGSAGGAEEENSFIVLHNDDTLNTLETHRIYVIDAAKKTFELNGGRASSQDVFAKYPDFKTVMRKKFEQRTGKRWLDQHIQVWGKPMIFPGSQFGVVGGYKEDMLRLLRTALCNH